MAGILYLYHVYKDQPDQEINLLINRNDLQVPGWKCIPDLAPSQMLMRKFIDWQFERRWQEKRWPTFKSRYREELRQEPALYYVQVLIKRLHEGRSIAIGCNTRLEEYSPIKVIGEIIRKMNFTVVVEKERRKDSPKVNAGEPNMDLNMQLSLYDL